MKSREIGFWDYMTVLVRWRRLILINFVLVCLIAIVLSFILPKWYTAKATLLPPEGGSGASAITSLLSDIPLGGLSIPGASSSADLFVAILESKTVAEGVIRKLTLQDVYRSKNLESAVQTLHQHSSIGVTKEGIITIEVEEKNSQLAAQIANAYVDELDRVNQESSISQAKNKRLFVQGRLEEAHKELERAENELKLFQQENKAISLPDQVSAAIEGAAQLKVEQIALEIELGVLLKTAAPTHPRATQLRSKIAEIEKQLGRIEFGEDLEYSGEGAESRDSQGFNVPFSQVPSVGLELARRTRKLKIQEVIYELLTQQYEQAKIEEAKDTPTVQVLDIASPPIMKSKPNRKMFVIFLGFLSLFLSMLYVFSIEYLRRLKLTETEKYDRIIGLFQTLKGDVQQLSYKWRKPQR